MEEEEDDYMGDLSKLLPSQPTHQPKKLPLKSLTSSSSSSSQPPKKKPKWAETKKLERERKQLQEDQQTLQNLTSAIPQSNIGFKMLQQMGYKPGSGLGKEGRVDPVGVEIRRSRAGIGREDPAKERVKREEREKRGERELMEEFGVRQRVQWRSKRVVASFYKAKAALDQLENREVVVVEKEEEEGGSDKEEEEEVVITEEDLLEILMKLREEHRYCLYCGCQYESTEALLTNCPGVDEDDH